MWRIVYSDKMVCMTVPAVNPKLTLGLMEVFPKLNKFIWQ